MTGAGQPALPARAFTFVLTDIEGSTPITTALGDGYRAFHDEYCACLEAVCRSLGGHGIPGGGDGFLAAFDSADDAVAAAVAAQEALAAVDWPTELPVLVRMGVHTGFAYPHRGDYMGLAVHQAARIMGAAHGGQILLSADTARLVTRLPEHAAIESLGHFRVRDFTEPQELHQVRTATLPARQAAPRAVPADGHNLVGMPGSLHGRDADLQALESLVAAGRVVTIAGPGGIGKTRLAIEHGLRTAPRWDGGVWFVDLAATTSPSRVDDAVADAVGARTAPDRDVRLDILDHLRDQHVLVLLDNCEHLAPAPAHLVRELLERCPGVGFLATSRSPLGLLGEQVHRLGPLGTQGDDAPAVGLFLERAGTTAAHDLPLVRDLCDALDGLPLAIELAAARAPALGLRLLLDRLRDSLAIVRSDDPTLPDRQRTLEAVLDWSHELLDRPTQELLSRLAVFATSFDLDVVLAAWGRDDEHAVVERLLVLVEQSLVERDTVAGPSRFRLPATVRTHALGRSGPEELARAARSVGTVLLDRFGPDRAIESRWVGDVAVELDNLRAIVHRVAGVDDDLGQALAWSIGYHHDVTNAFATGADELSGYVDMLPSTTATRVALLALLADLDLRADHLDRAEVHLHQAQAICDATGSPTWDDACVIRTSAELALKQGDAERAAARCREALPAVRSPRGRARLLSILGIAHATLGDLPQAAEAFRAELQVELDAGIETYLGNAHGNLAETLLRLGDERGAAAHQLQALDWARAHGDLVQTAFSMLVAARLCAASGRPGEAVTLQTAATAALDDAGFALYEADRSMLDELAGSARSHLGDAELAAAERRGRDRALDDVADDAARVLAGLMTPDHQAIRSP